MFIGEYHHTLDEKKRVSVPKALQKGLGKSFVVTRGLDSAVFCYPQQEWKKIQERLVGTSFTRSDARGITRLILSGAAEVTPDASGRILIPENLTRFAALDKEIVFAGVGERVEIWSAVRWSEYQAAIERDANALAETLGTT